MAAGYERQRARRASGPLWRPACRVPQATLATEGQTAWQQSVPATCDGVCTQVTEPRMHACDSTNTRVCVHV